MPECDHASSEPEEDAQKNSKWAIWRWMALGFVVLLIIRNFYSLHRVFDFWIPHLKQMEGITLC